jgi:hypothetical protein
MKTRQALHVLVDELPDDELAAARRFLEFLRQQGEDPLRSFLDSAPWDDETLTEEDQAAIQEGLAEKARGEVLSREELVRTLREAK